MSSAVRSSFVEKLVSQVRCPVCGDDRSSADETSDHDRLIATYGCGAVFAAGVDFIASRTPCASGSTLAAKLMSIEAKGKARQSHEA